MAKVREKDLKKVRDEHFSHATKQGIKPILVFNVRTKAFPGTKRERGPKFFCVFVPIGDPSRLLSCGPSGLAVAFAALHFATNSSED